MEVGKKKFIAPISLKFSECYLCIVRIYKYSYRDGRKTHINIGQKQQLAPWCWQQTQSLCKVGGSNPVAHKSDRLINKNMLQKEKPEKLKMK